MRGTCAPRTVPPVRPDLEAVRRQPDGVGAVRRHHRRHRAQPAGQGDAIRFRANGSRLKFPGFLEPVHRGPRRHAGRGRGAQAAARADAGRAAGPAPAAARAALHRAAAALHRGDAGEGAGGARHRPPVHLRADPVDDPGPRLRRAHREAPPPDRARGRWSTTCSSRTSATSWTWISPRTWKKSWTRWPRASVPWVPLIRDFYEPFHETLECAEQTSSASGRPTSRPTRSARSAAGNGHQAGSFRPVPGLPGVSRSAGTPSRSRSRSAWPPALSSEILEKRTKKKRVFYGCFGYPNCEWTSWSKPVPEKCPTCGGLMVEAGRDRTRCLTCSPLPEPRRPPARRDGRRLPRRACRRPARASGAAARRASGSTKSTTSRRRHAPHGGRPRARPTATARGRGASGATARPRATTRGSDRRCRPSRRPAAASTGRPRTRGKV